MSVAAEDWAKVDELPRPTRIEWAIVALMVAAVAALPFLIIEAGHRTHAAGVQFGKNFDKLGPDIAASADKALGQLGGDTACAVLRTPTQAAQLSAHDRVAFERACAAYERTQLTSRTIQPTR
jgi:hypothetical protein